MSDNKNNRFGQDGKYYFKSARNAVSTIIVKHREVNSAFTYLTNRLTELNNMQQDLLHYIEFSQLSAVEGYKTYKKLKEVRVERRLVKNELESMEIAHDALLKMNDIMNTLQQAQGKCEKIEKKQSISTYHQRAKKLLQIEDFDKQMKNYDDNISNRVVIK